MPAISELGNTLPIGMSYRGTKFNTFEIGYAKGSLRRQLSNISQNNVSKMQAVALHHVITKLGNVDAPDLSFIQRLTVPDVEYIMLLLSARDLEDKIKVEAVCRTPEGGGCGFEFSDTVAPSRVELIPGNAVEFVNDMPTQSLTIRHPESGAPLHMRFKIITLKEGDEEFERATQAFRKASKGDRPIGDVVHDQLTRFLVDFNGSGRGLTTEELDGLSLPLYDAVVEAYNNLKIPRLDLEVEMKCPKCGEKHIVDLPYYDWMRPLQRKGL